MNCARHIVHVEIGRDEAEYDGRPSRHIVELTQTLRREFRAREIGGLHIARPYSSKPCKRRTRLRGRLRGRWLCRKRLRLDPIRE